MGARREARIFAVQFFYQHDLNKGGREHSLDDQLADFWSMGKPEKNARVFAEELIRGAAEKLQEVDAKITSLADNWEFERIAVVDRNVLRLAVYEMLFRDDIPPVVSINEAIDIAKGYSTEQSGRFVNGILDRLKSELMRPTRHSAGQ